MSPVTLTAKWIVPVDRPPLPRGTITIVGESIASVDPAGVRTPDDDLGEVAILPGFVNAHTHLDLTGAAASCPPTTDFTDWLRRVIAFRRSQSPEAIQCSVEQGIRDSLRFGVTSIGDIAFEGASWDALAASPLTGVVFYEAIGLSSSRAEATLTRLRNWLDTRSSRSRLSPGISPHAPYTVGRSLLDGLGDFDGPFAIHLAETRDELALLADRSGRFVAFLEEMGVYEPTSILETSDWLTFAKRKRASLVHINFLDPTLVSVGQRVVYCPRTHAAFGHSPYPLREFLGRGAIVALGTDSLASNPDLDVLAEAKFVRAKFPDLTGEAIVRMITCDAAEAIGMATIGSLTSGKDASLVVIPAEDGDVYEAVLRSSVLRVMARGQWHDPV